MRWHSHPCFLLVGNTDFVRHRRPGLGIGIDGSHSWRRMPKRPFQENDAPRSLASQKSTRLGGVMERPQRSRSPSPADVAAASPAANSRLEDAAAAAAASAAVANADNFDVRVSLTRLGSVRRDSNLEDFISVPGASSPRNDAAAAVDKVVGVAHGAASELPGGAELTKNGGADNGTNVVNGGDGEEDDVQNDSGRLSISQSRSAEDASVDTKVESVDNEEEKEGDEPTSVKLRLTPEESRLFDLLTRSAEAYESGALTVDPDGEVSARGGFVKSNAPADERSWLQPPPAVEKIEIRVAGGWVRDKLLDQHSCDVDIALDCMMGVQFARIVQSYMKLEVEREEAAKAREAQAKDGGGATIVEDAAEEVVDAEPADCCKDPPSKRGKAKKKKKKQDPKKSPKIGVIGANPSQSKHLETATMTIHAIDVDFVNLRAEEVYLPGSRIPTSDTKMFGTPLEDALRRDFTINSLFYNVRSGRIEDWTGRGIDDLSVHRRIVTPVDPHVTFHDDPLRVLRAIRFAVRLGFELDEPIVQAARSKRVHHSLHVKVSRERVGKEVEGMLSGKHARPAKALDMIAALHLAGSVFCFPGSFPGDSDGNYYRGPNGGPVVSGDILGVKYSCSLGAKDCADAAKLASRQRARGWEESSALLTKVPSLIDGHADERESIVMQATQPMPLTELNERLLHLCVFILPFHNLTFPDKKGTRTVSVTAHMIKEALKFPVRDVQAVSKILSNVDEMAAILSEVRAQLEGGAKLKLCRLRMGMLLRTLKEHWATCLVTAAAWEIRTRERSGEEIRGDDFGEMVAAATAPAAPESTVEDGRPARELYRAIVTDLELDECWKVPPLFNGKEIIKELGLPNGPIVGEYLDDQTRWMLLHPEGTKEECAEHLLVRKREREEEEKKAAAEGSDANGAKLTNEGANREELSSKKIRPEEAK